MMLEIIGGWDVREPQGYELCAFSAWRRTSTPDLWPRRLMEKKLRSDGLYKRPHEQRDGQTWDVISDAPMATSFACSRFLVPWIAKSDWAVFCDFADMLFLEDPAELFALADERFAVQVVKHEYKPSESIKMDGQMQTFYQRKNWSSMILWNLRHPANDRLTREMVNTLPGRDLHRFCWLEDDEIGELPHEWNYLVGVDTAHIKPKLLHFTLGTPELGIDGPYADVWNRELEIMHAMYERRLA